MLAVFVSILIHELGHTFAFRYFGISSHIVLYHFGGLAIPDSYGSSWGSRSIDPRANALISAAGPLAQMVAAVLVMGVVGISGHGFIGGFGFLERILPIPNGEPFASRAVESILVLFLHRQSLLGVVKLDARLPTGWWSDHAKRVDCWWSEPAGASVVNDFDLCRSGGGVVLPQDGKISS